MPNWVLKPRVKLAGSEGQAGDLADAAVALLEELSGAVEPEDADKITGR